MTNIVSAANFSLDISRVKDYIPTTLPIEGRAHEVP